MHGEGREKKYIGKNGQRTASNNGQNFADETSAENDCREEATRGRSFEEDVTRDRLLATAHKAARFMLMARVSETLARRKAERKRTERERRSLGEEKCFDVIRGWPTRRGWPSEKNDVGRCRLVSLRMILASEPNANDRCVVIRTRFPPFPLLNERGREKSRSDSFVIVAPIDRNWYQVQRAFTNLNLKRIHCRQAAFES